LGFILKSGERFELNLQQSYDRLDNNFDLTDSAVVPGGKYHMHNTELQFGTYHSRKVWIEVLYNWGKFYSGNIKTFATEVGVNLSKHLNLKTDYTYNYITLPDANVRSNELAQYINYAFTTRIDLSLFAQWNSLDDVMFFNFRLHWIPKIGTDLYVVYNRGYEQLNKLDVLKPQTSAGIGKLIWRFTF
jgi:outer membrane protein assembly factor BamA